MKSLGLGLFATLLLFSACGHPAMGAEVDTKKLIDQGSTLMESEKWSQAVQKFEEALRLDPDNEMAKFGLGTAYIKTEQYDKALSMLSPLLKQFPSNPALLNNVAWVYATSKDPKVRNIDLAISYARDALLIAPNDPNIWSTMAETYYASGQFDKALRYARVAIQIAGSDGRGIPNELERLYRKCMLSSGAKEESQEQEPVPAVEPTE